MPFLDRLLGPPSKYDRRLPYTYEARVPVAGIEGMVQSYVGDTLCGILERLDAAGVEPEQATLVEVRPEGELPIAMDHCIGPAGRWLHRPEACRSFKAHYGGHTDKGRCCYADRSREVSGPFVDFSSATTPEPPAPRAKT